MNAMTWGCNTVYCECDRVTVSSQQQHGTWYEQSGHTSRHGDARHGTLALSGEGESDTFHHDAHGY